MTYQQPLPCNIAVSDRCLPTPPVRLLYPPTPPSAALSTHSPSLILLPKSNTLSPLIGAGRYTYIYILVYNRYYSLTKVALMCAVAYDLHTYLHQSTWPSSRPQPYLRPSAAFCCDYARLLAEKSNFALGKQDRSGDVQPSIEPSGLWPQPFPSPGKPIRFQSP
ncbi:hypothetical protein COCSADRAFT_355746 [Bipolaris sorokiniana ND90Pr]|uniref:Uncharacterized protein n=1 Tax=Cochliobolus sativus (strain ND90Pr / ATCC 201652) TaxID=665912 RepID=M2RCV0_COCSN|nr:uncharacterized protein COCSADRAFT_355746 [Bipolaris sorokiniana ND90Pr]EMD64619.1 hypothetical protein COCSADRAFT_355746 [Bipolaris sorokiniana ND90Pr]